MEKVSVVIPTYKRNSEMLSRAIFSVLNQSYKNTEIVVIDDNAAPENEHFRTENKKVIKKLLEEYTNIRFIENKKNLGGSLSRNEGINIATGKYVTFLDDDDIFLKQKIEHQVKFMEENGLNCSFTDLSIFNEKEELIDKRVRNDIKSYERNYLLKYHLTKTISSTETFMVSRKLLLDIGGFDDALTGQEFYLMWKILNYPDLKIGYFESDDIKAYRTKAEAISTGPNKIKGEKALYEFRKKHFDMLNRKERNYIKCRHRAVMSVSYKRNKKYFRAILYLFAAFITNPITSFIEAFGLKKKISGR